MANAGIGVAAEVTLAWDPSPDTNVVGYNVYWGTASRNYTQVQNAGNSTSTTISNLVEGTTYYFAATAYDNWGLESDYSAEAIYTVSFAVGNYPPTLNAINAVSVAEDAAAFTVNLAGISSGASTESQTLTVTATSSNPAIIPAPTVAYTSPSTTGTLTLQPVANQSGTSTITVNVNDGGSSNNIVTRTFLVTVSPVNDAPTLNAINALTVLEDAAAFTVNLAGISSGASNEPQTLTVTATSSNPGVIPAPTVTYTSPSTTGTLTLRPVANQSGTSTITVNVNDGGSSNNIVTRTFLVTVSPVNDAPTINTPANISFNSGATSHTVSLSGITSGATNEAQVLVVTATSSNPALIPAPAVAYTSPATTGTLTLSPLPGSGTATITVTVNDGGAMNATTSKSFVVTIQAVNNPPTLNVINALTVLEDAAAFTVNLAGISSGASTETQTLTLTATSSNPGLIPTPIVAYTSPSTTGTLTLQPVANQSGTSTITVNVNDGGSSNNIVTRTFLVTVSPVNDAPTINTPANISFNSGATYHTVSLSGITSGATNESQVLAVTATSSNPTLIPAPTVAYTSPATTGTLTLSRLPGSGTATITVTVNDGGAMNATTSKSFVVTIQAVNSPPTLNAINAVSVLEDAAPFTVNLAGISSGASTESQTLTVTATSSNPALIPAPTVAYTSPSTTGTLTLRPVANQSGTSTITVNVNDGGSSNNIVTRTFLVTVSPVNDAPTINTPVNISFNSGTTTRTVSLSGITSGATNEAQVLVVTATSSNPALIPAPTVAYTSPATTGTLTLSPLPGSGTATITVIVNDGGAMNAITSKSFVVTVQAVNNPPTLNAINAVTVLEDAAAFTVNLAGISSGASTETQTLTVTATSSNPALIPAPTVAYTSPSTTGTLTLRPVANQSGTSTITVNVNDGGSSNNIVTRTFLVTVSPVNDAPTINTPANISFNSGATSHTVSLSGITSGATNESQVLVVTATSSNPTLIPNPTVAYTSPATTGTLTLSPLPGSGTATITVTVNDGGSHIATRSVSFTVTVNNAPVISDIPDRAIALGSNMPPVAFVIGDAETSADSLVLSASSSNLGLVAATGITFDGSGTNRTIAITPVPGITGVVSITVTVSDGLATTSDTFQLAVQPRPAAPGSLRLDIEGLGRVSPILPTSLTLGRTYTLTATPSAGHEFAGWSGTIESSLSSIKFVAKGPIQLKAKFVPSPFISTKGTYRGLFYEQDGVQQYSGGFFTLTSTDRGKYTGHFQIGLKRYSFTGKFGLDGGATNRFSRSGTNLFTIRFRLPTDGSETVTGDLIENNWTAQLTGYKSSFSTLSNPAPWAGRYTVVLARDTSDSAVPFGNAYATLVVAKSGSCSLSGQLPDGSSFSRGVFVANRGELPLYIPLYSGSGSILSWTGMDTREADDLNGDVQWTKQNTLGKSGFSISLLSVGSKYLAGKTSVPGFTSRPATVVFELADRQFTNTMFFSTKNVVTTPKPNRLVMAVSPSTGVFNGTVIDPVTGKSLTYRGVFLQKQNAGYGYIKGTACRGRVTVF